MKFRGSKRDAAKVPKLPWWLQWFMLQHLCAEQVACSSNRESQLPPGSGANSTQRNSRRVCARSMGC